MPDAPPTTVSDEASGGGDPEGRIRYLEEQVEQQREKLQRHEENFATLATHLSLTSAGAGPVIERLRDTSP